MTVGKLIQALSGFPAEKEVVFWYWYSLDSERAGWEEEIEVSSAKEQTSTFYPDRPREVVALE